MRGTTTPTAIATPAAADARKRAPRRAEGDRRWTVTIYATLALVALIPGVITAAAPGFADRLPFGASLRTALEPIGFGKGLRFWLGVTGAAMIAILLLYPLRKLFARPRALGPISGWFHIHLTFGLFGPVLVLYHTGFGLGGSNANVALWAMLIVALSGLIGYFVHTPTSAAFYADRQAARSAIDAIGHELQAIGISEPARQGLLEAFAAFESELLAPRAGVVAGVRARWRVEQHARALAHGLASEIDRTVRDNGLGARAREEARRRIAAHLALLVRMARRAARRSLAEQLLARWRLFHLPVFAIMVAATVMHVVAVWPRATTVERANASAVVVPVPTVATAAAPAVVPPAVKGRPGASAPPPAPTPTQAAAPATAAPPTPGAAPAPIAASRAQLPSRAAAPSADRPIPTDVPKPVPVVGRRATPQPEAGAAGPAPPLVAEPQPAWRAPTATAKSAPKPAATGTVASAQIASEPSRETARAAPRAAAEARAERPPAPSPPLTAAPATAPTPPTPAPRDPLYAELEKRMADGVMALGGPKPRTLAEQVALLKARMAAGQFSHSLAETGFEHTGKHAKLDCLLCHAKPLRLVRSESPRACIDCHKGEDIHKGRQPECASCHTTNRWSEIVKSR